MVYIIYLLLSCNLNLFSSINKLSDFIIKNYHTCWLLEIQKGTNLYFSQSCYTFPLVKFCFINSMEP